MIPPYLVITLIFKQNLLYFIKILELQPRGNISVYKINKYSIIGCNEKNIFSIFILNWMLNSI